MNHSDGYTYNAESRIVTLDSPAEVTVSAIVAQNEFIVADSAIPRDAGFLIDFRSGTCLFRYDEIHQLLLWHEGRGRPMKGRRAFIVDRPITIGTANIYCTLLRLHGIEAEMFPDQDSAIAWLSDVSVPSRIRERGSGNRSAVGF
jgi:hypothetical protein